MSMALPATIRNEEVLDDLLSEPTRGAVKAMGVISGDLIVLGAGGKMGPTITRMARAASDAAGVSRRVIAVSRFSDERVKRDLNERGIETIPRDLMAEDAFDNLPDVENVLYMVGSKFGTTGEEARTWAVNTLLPARVCEKYRRSRIVAFSTGNVYGLTPVTGKGSVETDALNPQGDYAMSCVGRERVIEYLSKLYGIASAIIRLNYACELRYGVLVDLARWIWAGEPVDLAMGCLNVIWQGDANAMTLQSFPETSAPPFIINITGGEKIIIQEAAEEFARRMNKDARFENTPAHDALLSDAGKSFGMFGKPVVPLEKLYDWIADWVMSGGTGLGKPTHFEVRDGKF